MLWTCEQFMAAWDGLGMKGQCTACQACGIICGSSRLCIALSASHLQVPGTLELLLA
jgi:hypothetical protein